MSEQRNPSISYEAVCKYVGQLFLESRHELESLLQSSRQSLAEMQKTVDKVTKERDDALKLWADNHAKLKQES